MSATVGSLRSVEFRVPDVSAAADFYENAWGLREVARGGNARYLRATGGDHHIVVLHHGERGLARVNLGTSDRAGVDALYAKIRGAGATPLEKPHDLDEPGGGYGFSFRDADAGEFRISAGVAVHADTAPGTDRPIKLSHIVLNSDHTDANSAFFVDVLGFRVRDQTRMMDFLGCNTDHHSVAFTRFAGAGLNHVAFDIPSIDALMRGSGRLKQHGFRIQWGVGRHGPGANVFAYFLDPHDFAIEYTAEMEQVDDATYGVGKPEDWSHRGSNNPDAWNLADPPTDRFQQATGAPAAPAREPAATH